MNLIMFDPDIHSASRLVSVDQEENNLHFHHHIRAHACRVRPATERTQTHSPVMLGASFVVFSLLGFSSVPMCRWFASQTECLMDKKTAVKHKGRRVMEEKRSVRSADWSSTSNTSLRINEDGSRVLPALVLLNLIKPEAAPPHADWSVLVR